MTSFKKYLRIILKIVLPAVGFCLTVWIGWKGILFFMPFVIGWIIAMIGNPIVRYLERKLKIVRKAGSFLIVAGVIALIILGGYFLLSWLIREAISFVVDAPDLFNRVQAQIEEALTLLASAERFLPDELWEQIMNIGSHLGSAAEEMISHLGQPTVEAAGNLAKSIPNALVYAVVTVLSSYFFIADSDRIMASLKVWMPRPIVRYLGIVKQNMGRAVGGYFAAQFKIMFVVAFILTVGFMIIGVRYSLLWAILIAMLDFLPVFGTGTVLIPWALIQFVNREFYMGVALLVIYFISQLMHQLLQPKLVGDSMGLPPLLTLVLLYIGFRWRGIGGMILAVPIGLILIEIAKAGVFDTMLEGVRELIGEIRTFMAGGKSPDSQEEKDEIHKDAGHRQ